MAASTHPLIEIIADHAETAGLSEFELVRLSRIKACHDKTLGTHVLSCDSCGTHHVVANTCKALHCPSCSYVKSQKWTEARVNEVINCQYFHNVFTIPHEFNELFQHNFSVMGNMLFKAVSDTLNQFSGRFEKDKTKQRKPGFMLFLHTWDQELKLHYHIHAVIAGGFLRRDRIWEDGCKGTNKNFLFSVKALQKVFRGKFIDHFIDSCDEGKINWKIELTRAEFLSRIPKQWNVYSKSADGHPDKVIEYLGRYTHRTGLAKSRLDYDGENVTIKKKDRKAGQLIDVRLPANSFLKRFSAHFYQDSIARVRYYGFLANAAKSNDLAQIKNQVGSSTFNSVYEKPRCGKCSGSEMTMIYITWRAAPLIGKRKGRPRGPPGCHLESAKARPSFVDSQHIVEEKIGPNTKGEKSEHA